VLAGGQQQLGPQLLGGQPQLVETRGLGLEPGLAREVAERRTSPQRQRVVEAGQRPGGRPRRHGRAGVAEVGLEPGGVDLAGGDVEDVAGRPRPHRARARAVGSRDQQLAQLVHVGAQRAGAGGGHPVAPDLVDQPLGGDDVAGPQHQVGQHRPLAGTAERDLLTVALDHQRTEDLEGELAFWHRRARPTACPAAGSRLPDARTP
jgi:hypothetical protein